MGLQPIHIRCSFRLLEASNREASNHPKLRRHRAKLRSCSAAPSEAAPPPPPSEAAPPPPSNIAAFGAVVLFCRGEGEEVVAADAEEEGLGEELAHSAWAHLGIHRSLQWNAAIH